MTRKEQNKILDDKIESNVNQYKVDRLNAEISAFSSGDLNKYKFLKRVDLNYKPNALDKARFEFSPLGKTVSTGLDKTAQGYQEEGIMKLLKDIRDGLAGGITPRTLGRPGGSRGPGLDSDDDDDDDSDDDDDDEDDDDDDDENMPDLETEEEAAERIALNKFIDKINNFDEMFKNKENEFNKRFKDKENELSTKLNKLNNDVKKINNYIKENNDKINSKEKEYNKLLLKYSEINRELNKIKDELYRARNDITEQKKIQEKFNYQKNKVEELKSELNEKKNIDKLKYNIKNLENINKINNIEIEKIKKSKTSDDKVSNISNKFKNNTENKMSDLDKMVTSKENEWNTKLNKLNNDAKKIDNYI